MHEDLANLIHPVIRLGLDLRERLVRGELCQLDVEQAALRQLLLTEVEAKRWPEFGGDILRFGQISGQAEEGRVEPFLGVRYALTCWLDELFILYSPWSSVWNEHKLEVAVYGTNDRAWRFWQQAGSAESRPSLDALEVFFLCVMLGFRGDWLEAPDRLRAWVLAAQTRLTQLGVQEWPHPPELEPATNVPPLRARARLQRVVYIGGFAVLLLIPVVAFLVVQQLGY